MRPPRPRPSAEASLSPSASAPAARSSPSPGRRRGCLRLYRHDRRRSERGHGRDRQVSHGVPAHVTPAPGMPAAAGRLPVRGGSQGRVRLHDGLSADRQGIGHHDSDHQHGRRNVVSVWLYGKRLHHYDGKRRVSRQDGRGQCQVHPGPQVGVAPPRGEPRLSNWLTIST